MKKFQKLNLIIQALVVYLISLLCSIIVSPLFGKLYIAIFNPRLTGGLFPSPDDPGALFDGAFFAFFLFLPFFVFWLTTKKQCLIWLIGAIIPLSMVLVGGTKDFVWALILTIVGYLLAKGILLIKEKRKG